MYAVWTCNTLNIRKELKNCFMRHEFSIPHPAWMRHTNNWSVLNRWMFQKSGVGGGVFDEKLCLWYTTIIGWSSAIQKPSPHLGFLAIHSSVVVYILNFTIHMAAVVVTLVKFWGGTTPKWGKKTLLLRPWCDVAKHHIVLVAQYYFDVTVAHCVHCAS